MFTLVVNFESPSSLHGACSAMLQNHHVFVTNPNQRRIKFETSHQKMSTAEMDEVVQGRLRLQRDLVLEESLNITAGQNEKNWMDLNRKQIKAYEYLCHIGEAKQWIEACSNQELPPVVELDEHIRNGVVLAKLAKKFKPDIVKKIFGEDVKLQFRHSDNINYFFTFCKMIELPDVFVFELTDLYDKKNIPKVIYCIHALAHLLAAKRLAPAIKDLRGKLQFTDAELENTQKQIEEMNLPDFNGAGAALAKEMGNPYAHIESHFNDNPNDLQLIQRIFQGAIVRLKHQNQLKLYNQQLPFIILLQARIRGYLCHLYFKSLSSKFAPLIPHITQCQANIKYKLQRTRFLKIHQYLHGDLTPIILFQTRFKGFLYRRNFIRQSNVYKLKSKDIVKIQSKFRQHYTRTLYLQLINESPSWQAIQLFHHLLGASNVDYNEELELTNLRQSVVKYIRDISQLESLINDLDLKVALIVKNRMSLEDITKLSKSTNTSIPNATTNDLYSIFKLVDKDSRHKQEVYQNLLYLLQTNPQYLSNIILEMRQMTSETIKKFIEQTVLTLFGYAQHPREEYLLLSLFNVVITSEIKDVDNLSDFIKSNPQFVRLVVNYIRGAKDRQFLQSILQQPILQVLQSDQLELDSDPISIYKKMIIKQETETGQKSNLKLDISKEEALLNPQVLEAYTQVMLDIHNFSKLFLDSIFSSVHTMPFGIRYISYLVQSALTTKFPNEDPLAINRVIGNLIFFRYINPAIVAPEAFDVIPSDKTLSTQQRKNLSEISKSLNMVSIGRTSATDIPMVIDYVQSNNMKFNQFLLDVTHVVSKEEYFSIDNYSDFTLQKKPILFISPTEIIGLHKLLIEYQQYLLEDDIVNRLLGELPVITNSIDEILSMKSKEQSMTLLNNLVPRNDQSGDIENKQLFTETKRLLLIVMQTCHGSKYRTLLELLEKQTTQEQEEAFVIGNRGGNTGSVHVLGSKVDLKDSVVNQSIVATSVTQLSGGSLHDIKKLILMNLQLLEQKQTKVTKRNGYLELITSISKVYIKLT